MDSGMSRSRDGSDSTGAAGQRALTGQCVPVSALSGVQGSGCSPEEGGRGSSRTNGNVRSSPHIQCGEKH